MRIVRPINGLRSNLSFGEFIAQINIGDVKAVEIGFQFAVEIYITLAVGLEESLPGRQEEEDEFRVVLVGMLFPFRNDLFVRLRVRKVLVVVEAVLSSEIGQAVEIEAGIRSATDGTAELSLTATVDGKRVATGRVEIDARVPA